MNTDLPLTSVEKDKLGRGIFATEIASGLVHSFENNNESIVLGINGTWGSGKSTLINFIINEVEKFSQKRGQKIITLRFNPWVFSGQKELQNIFLKELLLKLEANKEKFKNVSEKVADFLNHLNWLKYVHSGAGEIIKDTQDFLKGISKEKDLGQLKSEIDDLLIKSKVKLYITIDDIDRLTPSEITDIFQLVKLNGNFANTIFILAYDQQVVMSVLANQFGENGKKYIEKIVQVDYTLPAISKENIIRIFIDSLNNLFQDESILSKINDLIEIIKEQEFVNYFKSLRDIYRFNNSVKLRLPSIYRELNILEFLKIEAVRIFEPVAYQFIIDNKDSLIYVNKDKELSFGKVDEGNNTQKIIDNSKFSENTKCILSELFVITNNYVFSVTNDDLIREKRVANRNYFDRYFNLQLGNFDIQESVFEKFISNSIIKEKEEILAKIKSEDKLFTFLHWVEIKSENCSPQSIDDIVTACFNFINQIGYKRESFWGYDTDFMTLERFCSRMLEKVRDIKTRRNLVIKHIRNNSFSALYNSYVIINAKNRLDEGKLSYHETWNGLFSQDEVDNNIFMKVIVRHYKKVSKILFQKELEKIGSFNDDEITFILPIVKEYFSDFYDEQFPKLILNDKDLIRYLWLSIKKVFMTSGLDVGYQFAEWQMFSGMDKEDIKKRLEGMDKEVLSNDEIKIIDLFFKAYEDGFKEKIYYNIKTLEVMDRS